MGDHRHGEAAGAREDRAEDKPDDHRLLYARLPLVPVVGNPEEQRCQDDDASRRTRRAAEELVQALEREAAKEAW